MQATTFSGTVFQDLNANGVQDPGEPGIAGFAVYYEATDYALMPNYALTDASGHWSLTLGPGAHRFSPNVSGFYLTTPVGGRYDLTATPAGGNVTGLDFGVVTIPPSTGPAASIEFQRNQHITAKLPALAMPGAMGNVILPIVNNGNAISTGPLPIRLYAARGGVLDQNAQLLATLNPKVALAPNRATRLHVHFRFPSGLIGGSDKLIAVMGIDRAETSGGPSFEVAASSPDLALSFASPPPLALSHLKSGRVSLRIRNQSIADVNGTVNLALYASNDTSLDAGDRLLTHVPGIRVNLKRGRSQTIRLSFTPPANLSRTYYLIASLDVVQPTDPHPDDKTAVATNGTVFT